MCTPECVPLEFQGPVGKGPHPHHGSHVPEWITYGLLAMAVMWGSGDHMASHAD
jgi:hypothetical protein